MPSGPEIIVNIMGTIRHLPDIYRGVLDQVYGQRAEAVVSATLVKPEPARSEDLRKRIAEMEELLAERPSLNYLYHYLIGICHAALGEREQAVGHSEQAVLLHPNLSGEDANFFVHSGLYLRYVNSLNLAAISRATFRDRQKPIAQLELVIQSTDRVLQKYPQLDQLARENKLARAWYEKATGREAPKITASSGSYINFDFSKGKSG